MAKKKNSKKQQNWWFDWNLHWTLWGIGYAYDSDGDLAVLIIMIGPLNLQWTYN